jgi:adenylylsulfate kinase-like enzyme
MSILWITGLAGSGKTTLADALAARLEHELAGGIVRIDGDRVRAEIGDAGRGYSREQRLAVAQQIAERAQSASRAGHCAIVSTISLFHAIHAGNRASREDYFEVLLTCDPALRAQRLSTRPALHGPQVGDEIAPEFPHSPHLRLHSADGDVGTLAQRVLDAWHQRHV